MFLDSLTRVLPDQKVPPQFWKKDWVVYCKPVMRTDLAQHLRTFRLREQQPMAFYGYEEVVKDRWLSLSCYMLDLVHHSIRPLRMKKWLSHPTFLHTDGAKVTNDPSVICTVQLGRTC
jgi:hypothetical protein